ncbi:hypothetical protein D3C74_468440 [compost metagenome]
MITELFFISVIIFFVLPNRNSWVCQLEKHFIFYRQASLDIVSFVLDRVKLKQDTMYMNPEGGELHVETQIAHDGDWSWRDVSDEE